MKICPACLIMWVILGALAFAWWRKRQASE